MSEDVRSKKRSDGFESIFHHVFDNGDRVTILKNSIMMYDVNISDDPSNPIYGDKNFGGPLCDMSRIHLSSKE
jgi:hypothetical protein